MTDLNELYQTLGRIESKVDRLVPLEERVGSLERAWAKVVGISAVLSVLGSIAVQKLSGK